MTETINESGTTASAPVTPRLKTRYREEILPALKSEFDIANVMQVPGLVKIVVNMGVGEAARDSKLIEGAVRDLTVITGQKPVVTKAKKSIAQFKLREGMPLAAAVRRARQLHLRSHRAGHVPRDRPGPDRPQPRHGHHGRDHGHRRRPG